MRPYRCDRVAQQLGFSCSRALPPNQTMFIHFRDRVTDCIYALLGYIVVYFQAPKHVSAALSTADGPRGFGSSSPR
jgi:hypothetical protein